MDAAMGPANDLDATVDALQGGLTGLTPSAAVSNLDNWQQTLTNSDDPELQQLAGDLAELKGHLASGNLDGQQIGPLLQRIGLQTTTAADKAPAAVASKLRQLGQTLTSAGGSLAK